MDRQGCILGEHLQLKDVDVCQSTGSSLLASGQMRATVGMQSRKRMDDHCRSENTDPFHHRPEHDDLALLWDTMGKDVKVQA